MRSFAFCLLFALLSAGTAPAAVRLPRLVGDHLVLQRDRPLTLWGWADAGEAVRLTFRGQTYAATAPDSAGRWTAQLPPQTPGGPFELVVEGHNRLVLRDVLVGDVWLASGQSNMEWTLSAAQNGPAEVGSADVPQLRLLLVPKQANFRPQADVGGAGWQVCTPQTAADFSAVAYFFGRALLRQHPDVPVGLIEAAWGGTPAEAWTSAEGLQPFPDFRAALRSQGQVPGGVAQAEADYAARLAAWRQSPAGRDRGLLPGQPSWADPTFDASAWPTLAAPGLWEPQAAALRNFDGVLWLRKEFDLPAAAAGQPLTLSLAKIDDQDSTFFNGVPVGATRGYNKERRYAVPANLVRAGRNVVAVRVLDTGGGGGLWGDAADLRAAGPAGAVPLAGPWRYQPGYDPASVPRPPFAGGAQNQPAALFNGLVAPLRPWALRGVIWYQGESNADNFARAAQYRTLFPALIRDWRRQFSQPELPFVFVQLAAYGPDSARPADYPWARLREAQAQTLALPRTGMAVALDVGNPEDIHPLDKQTVGARLALAARRVAYGETAVEASGPTVAAFAAQGGTVRLRFAHAAGLRLKPAPAGTRPAFAVAGADRRFYWAQARMADNELVLSAKEVPRPVAARYAWSNSPAAVLYNGAGLPAPPFRTDKW